MPLPVASVLPDLLHALGERGAAVLQAPPGAGKTTLVPPALLDVPWLAGRKIIMLEPREKGLVAMTLRYPYEVRGDDDDAVANSRRTERRHPLVWMGEVYFAHSNEKVRLRNISENGALIEGPVQYPLGVELLLDLGDAGQHFATVSWTCGDKAGLKFSNHFDLKLLGSSKPEIAPHLMIRPGPGLQTSDIDNPWADGWQRQSLDELRDDLEGYLKR